MLSFLKSTVGKSLALSAAVLMFSVPSIVAAAEFKLDPAHTWVLWTADHIGYGKVNGKVFAEGTINYNEKDHKLSSVEATMDLNKMTTGDAKFDEHLKSKDFFDIAQYPTATFKSDKVTMKGKNMADVHGMLTLHGVSKPVTLNVTFRKHAMHPMNKVDAVGFDAKGTINRSDFGLGAYTPAVGNKVDLVFSVEGLAEAPKQAQ